jgi:hypothetical protein
MEVENLATRKILLFNILILWNYSRDCYKWELSKRRYTTTTIINNKTTTTTTYPKYSILQENVTLLSLDNAEKSVSFFLKDTSKFLFITRMWAPTFTNQRSDVERGIDGLPLNDSVTNLVKIQIGAISEGIFEHITEFVSGKLRISGITSSFFFFSLAFLVLLFRVARMNLDKSKNTRLFRHLSHQSFIVGTCYVSICLLKDFLRENIGTFFPK